MTGPRHAGLDILRLAAAFAVVALHLEPARYIPEIAWDLFWLLCRFAVPVFFLISGYFLSQRLYKPCEKTLFTLHGIFRLFVWSSLLYIPLALIRGSRSIPLDASFLLTGTCYHLWFLPSLGFAVLCFSCFQMRSKQSLLSCSCRIPFFPITASIILLFYALANLGITTQDENSIATLRFFSSLPLLGIGAWLGSKNGINFSGRFSSWVLIPILFLGIGIQFFESLNYSSPSGLRYQFGFGTLLFSLSLFLLAAKKSSVASSSLLSATAKAGSQLATLIYILHVWVNAIVKNAFEAFGYETESPVFSATIPLTFAGSLLSAFLIFNLLRKTKN